MEYLRSLNILDYSRPEDIDFSKSELLTKEFQKTISKDKFIENARFRFNSKIISKLYKSKISDKTVDMLVELGLAEKKRSLESFVRVESTVTDIYMSILAKHIADKSRDYIIPNTDRVDIFDLIDRGNQNGNLVFNLRLMDILPCATSDTSMEEICYFREKRRQELLNFRKVLDGLISDISQSNSNDEIKEKTIRFKEKIEFEVIEIEKMMKDSRINNFRKSMEALMSIKSPALYEVLLGNITKSEFLKDPKVVIATGCAQVLVNHVTNKNSERAKLRENPYSYLYYMKK
ncbi:DUF6236 family protein [Tepidibacter mesophilus]|uniref:DUF6236 family protein n=1 Tax=Tepidibacter mesophilus TaxID=655607 RepID=UPI000C07413C|nr:DUF6236 family protein [Tepidibacter mesophilus]